MPKPENGSFGPSYIVLKSLVSILDQDSKIKDVVQKKIEGRFGNNRDQNLNPSFLSRNLYQNLPITIRKKGSTN